MGKDRACIDLARVEAIQQIPLSQSKKSIQSFFGRIIFLRHFVPNFAGITKHISDMLRKGQDCQWDSTGNSVS
jgi:hypothetical protein